MEKGETGKQLNNGYSSIMIGLFQTLIYALHAGFTKDTSQGTCQGNMPTLIHFPIVGFTDWITPFCRSNQCHLHLHTI